MIIFILNYISSAIELYSMAKDIRGLFLPCLFFAVLLSYFTFAGWELAILTAALAFNLKLLTGALRLALQVWGDEEKIFYLFTLLETVFLWWLLRGLI
jgi:hypothetical protein